MTAFRNDLNKKTIFTLYYKKYLNKQQICLKLNCGMNTLNRRFKQWGWKFRESGQASMIFRKKHSKIYPHIKKIKKLYLKDKKSCVEIAKLYKVVTSAIQRLLRKYNVKLRKHSEDTIKLRISKNQLYDLYVNKKLGSDIIAKKYNVSRSTVENWLHKYNIDTKRKLKYNLKDLDQILKNNHIVRLTKMKKINDRKRHDKIKIKCLIDGHEWNASISNLLNGTGCPNCLYKGQQRTLEILSKIIKNKINPHYKLTTYIGKDKRQHKAFVDFFFTYKKYKIVVEYNGLQHYEPCYRYIKNAKQQFLFQIFRDKQIRKYCKQNNIILIEIDGRKYTKSDAIEKYLLLQFRNILNVKN